MPKLGAMFVSILMRLVLPIAVSAFAMLFLPSVLALLIGLALGFVINRYFTKVRKTYATYIQFVWFAGVLGYSSIIHIPFVNKMTPGGTEGIALGLTLLVVCTGAWFYYTRKERLDLSEMQDNLFRFLPIVLFFVILVVGIIKLPITTINGYGWNSGGGVIAWAILSALIALLISIGLAGIFVTIVFTWRGFKETLGFVYDYPTVIRTNIPNHDDRFDSYRYDRRIDELQKRRDEASRKEEIDRDNKATWDMLHPDQ